SATESGTTATITTAVRHNFSVGQQVTVSNVSVGGYNGTFAITAADNGTTSAITGASWAAGAATFTANNTFLPGQTVTVPGMTPAGYNGTFPVASANASSFTVSLASNPGAATAFGTATGTPAFAYTAGSSGLANGSGGTATMPVTLMFTIPTGGGAYNATTGQGT